MTDDTRARLDRAFDRALDAYGAIAGIPWFGPPLGLAAAVREAWRSLSEPVERCSVPDALTAIDEWLAEQDRARRAWALRMAESGVKLKDIKVTIPAYGPQTFEEEA